MGKYFGALKPKVDLRAYKLKPAGVTVYPDEFCLPKPIVKDQDVFNSCVGHAVASLIEGFNSVQEGNNDKFSPYFIYGYRPEGYYQGTGMYLSEALKTVQKIGAVKTADFPFYEEIPLIKDVVNSNMDILLGAAYPNRIETYYKCESKDATKAALMSGSYVTAVIIIYSDFIFNPITNEINSEKKNIEGYHAVTIYGWNKKGWIISNSWGHDWGNDGSFILPYDYGIEEAYGATDNIINFKKKIDADIVKPPQSLDAVLKALSNIINTIKSWFDGK